MRQKVALAGALVHDPDLIILDEPLTGLDAGTARQVKDLLQARVAAGGTVIMTTHILEVAERMAERIGVLSAGRLIAEGTLTELRLQVRPWRQPGGCLPDAGRRDGRGMTAPAGPSFAWLAAHEFRLAWRDWRGMVTAGGKRRLPTALAIMAVAAVLLHVPVFFHGR